MTKEKLYEFALPSTEFEPDTLFVLDTIRITYRRGDCLYRAGIRFTKVAAVRKRAERCATAWHVEEAYDTLVQIKPSPWAEEIRNDTTAHLRDSQRYNHYLIYIDSAGAYEVIADSWKAVEEEEGAWPDIC